MHRLVKLVHVSVGLYAVASVITNRAISTTKIVDAIFFAVSVLAEPIPQRVAFEQRQIVCECFFLSLLLLSMNNTFALIF